MADVVLLASSFQPRTGEERERRSNPPFAQAARWIASIFFPIVTSRNGDVPGVSSAWPLLWLGPQ